MKCTGHKNTVMIMMSNSSLYGLISIASEILRGKNSTKLEKALLHVHELKCNLTENSLQLPEPLFDIYMSIEDSLGEKSDVDLYGDRAIEFERLYDVLEELALRDVYISTNEEFNSWMKAVREKKKEAERRTKIL